MGKQAFWQEARIFKAGDFDGTFQEKTDCGKMKYSELRLMDELLQKITVGN
jgi:hypothetical protein